MNLQYYFQEVKQLLEKNDYQVIVRRDKNKIIVSYPLRVESPQSASFQAVYQITKGKLYFKIIIGGQTILETPVDVPKYVYKSVIIANVAKTCMELEYHTEFIRFYDGDREISQDEFSQVDIVKLSANDTRRQNSLVNIIPEIIHEVQTGEHQIEELAIDLNIYEGYIAVSQLFGKEFPVGD